jgi:hypothetical protein
MWENKTDGQVACTGEVGYDTQLYLENVSGCEDTAEMDFKVTWFALVELRVIHLKLPSSWIWHRIVWEIGTYEYERLGRNLLFNYN